MKGPIFSPPRPTSKRTASIQKRKQQPMLMSIKKQKNKSVQQAKRKRKVSIEVKTKFKISSDHMGFLIEQQKATDLTAIRSSYALNHYYQSLLSLFGLIYSSSQIITSNIFQCKKQSMGLSGLKFVGILFSIYEHVWNQHHMAKLKTMAKSVMKMGSTSRLFEQKIQFICRKIALNYNNRKRIQMAFLNTKLQSFWKLLIDRFKFNDEIQVLQDLYESAPQKMAYWDFTYFINNYLSNQQFYDVLKQSNRNRRKQVQQQDTLPHNFTYQFIIIQIFCFHQEEGDRPQKPNQLLINNKNCQLI